MNTLTIPAKPSSQHSKRTMPWHSSGLPWAGSYFNIPEPTENPNPWAPEVLNEIELEMHVIEKDLSLHRVIMKQYQGEGSNADMTNTMLRNIAYLNPNAMAYVIYQTNINGKTGERKTNLKEPELAVRRGVTDWQYVLPIHLHKIMEEFSDEYKPFRPEIFKLYKPLPSGSFSANA